MDDAPDAHPEQPKSRVGDTTGAVLPIPDGALSHPEESRSFRLSESSGAALEVEGFPADVDEGGAALHG
jgi:hypothetical protein